MSEFAIGSVITGFCVGCEQPDVCGRVVHLGRRSHTRMALVIDASGRCHEILEYVTQRLLTTQELAALTRKYKRQREEARKDTRSETTEPTQTEHHEITDAESGFEVAPTGEETSSELDK